MYICFDCGHVFEDPHEIVDDSPEYGRTVEKLCPKCESGFFERADRCPDCGKWKGVLDKLCEDCIEELRGRFRMFREQLTAAQEDMLEFLLDGNSVKDI